MYSEVMPEGYFSKKFGNDILRIAKKNLGFQGRILDFGCGPGFLLNKLVNIPNSKLYGVDASEENVLMTRQRLGGYKNFCFAELISESFFAKNHSAFDCVFLIECLEHILPEENQKFFEFSRTRVPSLLFFVHPEPKESEQPVEHQQLITKTVVP